MKNNFTIQAADSFTGKEVVVRGWIYNKRSSGALVFLQVRDGTGFIQATVVKSEVPPEVFTVSHELMLESSVEITGMLKKEPRATGGFEIQVGDIHVYQKVTEEYPIGKKEHGPDFLLSHRHLWLRSRRQWAIQQIRNTIIYAIYEYFRSRGFIKIDSPILTPVACEGTTTLFPVPYLPAWKDSTKPEPMSVQLGNPAKSLEDAPYAYLSQSGQLYLEAAIMAHGRVFDFGPTFRAEKSKTRRHLTEFWMMDAEMAFFDHQENMAIQEKMIVAIVTGVLSKNKKELEILERDPTALKPLLEGKFPIITHEDAVSLLKKKGIVQQERDDFGADAETIISQSFDKPVFVEKYPKEIKAFYMKENPDDTSRVLNDDLLAPEGYGEIIGGSQREDDYDRLLTRIKEHGYAVSDFQWYLDLRKFGSVPHSGFGLGLERIVAWICKLDHVRETIPFPRMMGRFSP